MVTKYVLHYYYHELPNQAEHKFLYLDNKHYFLNVTILKPRIIIILPTN